jgi:pimeloyl-ACP methyl ester carboxylesterase
MDEHLAQRVMRFPFNGHDVEVEVVGDGRPLLFVPGLATDRRVLMAAFEPLPSGWRRIYIDLPGHGGSKGDPDNASADHLVDLLAHVTRELCGDTAPSVIGYAYGGYLAQGLAAQLPLEGLYLLCPTVEADFGKRTVPPRRVVAQEELIFSEDPREKEAFEEVAVVQTKAALEIFQRVVHPSNIATDQAMLASIRGRYVMSRPYMQALQAFEKPVAILCGRDDHWVGWEDAHKLTRALRDAHYTVLPRCGHLLPFESPQLFRAHFEAWLARLD